MPTRDLGSTSGTLSTRRSDGSYATVTYSAKLGTESLELSVSPGFGRDNPFRMSRSVTSPGLCNGVEYDSQGRERRIVVNTPANIGGNWGSKAPAGEPSQTAAYHALIAGTNPTRPEVRLPVFFTELRELPMMIHQAGRILLNKNLFGKYAPKYDRDLNPGQRAAAANLAYNFGWAPMVQDLKKMILFEETVNKRLKEFERLYSGPGLKRRFQIFYAEASGEPNLALGTYIPSGIIGNIRGSWTSFTHVWGTVRWKPSESPFAMKATPADIKRMVFGLSSANIASNLWEALPWSWFIDWFTDFGDRISAAEGKLYAVPSFPCLMYHRRTVYEGRQTVNLDSWLKGGPARKVVESKERVVSPLSSPPIASWPILSAGQSSILGSLAVTRARWARF